MAEILIKEEELVRDKAILAKASLKLLD